jgi:hypothetical protein
MTITQDEEKTIKTRVAWGMLIGEDTGGYIDDLIDREKRKVKEIVEQMGLRVTKQDFQVHCEYGYLLTYYDHP